MKENKLVELSMDFSVDIINLVKFLKSNHETIISNQIGRSGTSIGANIHEAQYAQGTKDFISKFEIALKEASETGYWLELLFRTKYIDEQSFKTLSSKCTSLRVMLIASCKTAKENTKKNFVHMFLNALNDAFGSRIWFVGLQGSYGRGEETESSDIDMVVILDNLSVSDISTYNEMLNNLPHRELVCGFISGKEEIMNWEPSDLFQFCNDTTPIKGSLDKVLALIDQNAVNRVIKIGACNIYHGCVHNMLHEQSDDILRDLYKSASFVVQAIVFNQTGKYIKHQRELLLLTSLDEHNIVNTFLGLKSGEAVDFLKMSENLFVWSKRWVIESN